jgi:anti-sigma factor RsiW
MSHPAEDVLAAYALGLLAHTESQEVALHVASCPDCDRLTADYRGMAAALQAWCEAPPDVVAETSDAVIQRLRVHRLLNQLFVSQELRREVSEDPARVLTAHGIAPTPTLLAAFKDFSARGGGQFPGELDERLTKWQRLLEWFPGAPPPLGH